MPCELSINDCGIDDLHFVFHHIFNIFHFFITHILKIMISFLHPFLEAFNFLSHPGLQLMSATHAIAISIVELFQLVLNFLSFNSSSGRSIQFSINLIVHLCGDIVNDSCHVRFGGVNHTSDIRDLLKSQILEILHDALSEGLNLYSNVLFELLGDL